MIHLNGPLLHDADKFITAALDHHFTNVGASAWFSFQ